VKPCHLATLLLLAMTFEMSIAEFLAVQESDDHWRRARFKLPRSCKPAITATTLNRERMHVVVTCLEREGTRDLF
jgi:hypothetical protein